MRGTALLPDDEEPILALVAETIENIGDDIELLLARDGQEALDIAKREKPDVLILDVSMPKRNAYEVCQLLKRDPATSHARIIMLTGLDHEVARRKALEEAGADAYVCKPWSPTELLKIMGKLLKLPA